jgi:hypothetical protein
MAKSFAAWGDQNDYFVMPGGTFESSTSGWTLESGANVVVDQAPWRVNGPGHQRALALPAGSRVNTPTICVARGEESMRLFVKSPGVAGARLKVEMTVSNSRGSWTAVMWVNGSRPGWAPSNPLGYPDVRLRSATQDVKFAFSPAGTAATWVIDDVMVDPFVSR